MEAVRLAARYANDEAGRSGVRGVVIGGTARDARRRDVEVIDQRLGAVVGLRNRLAVERVRFDQVGAGLEVRAVDLLDEVGAREHQEVVVAAQLLRMGREPVTPEVLFLQAVGLDHRPHGAVQDEDAPLERGAELGDAGMAIGHGTWPPNHVEISTAVMSHSARRAGRSPGCVI
jgi:hypothetical protein